MLAVSKWLKEKNLDIYSWFCVWANAGLAQRACPGLCPSHVAITGQTQVPQTCLSWQSIATTARPLLGSALLLLYALR